MTLLYGSHALLIGAQLVVPQVVTPPPPPTPAPPPPGPIYATRFSVAESSSSGTVGSAVIVSATPQSGVWPAGRVLSLSQSVTIGTVSPSTIAPTAGGSASAVFTLTTTAANTSSLNIIDAGISPIMTSTGTVSYTATSVGTGPGTAGALTQTTANLANTAAVVNRHVFQRDVASGNPPGFSTTWNRGWGAISLAINTAGPSSSLFIRLYDADSSGAVIGSPGTGTLVQPAVAVTGAVAAGSSTQTFNVPAAPIFYYMDVALDAGMTNAIRIPASFGMGALTMIGTRSYGSCIVTQYAYDSTTVATIDMTQIVNMPMNAGSIYAGENNYFQAPGSHWCRPGNLGQAAGIADDRDTSTRPTYYYTTGGMEYLRLMHNQLGVVHGIIGIGSIGGGLEYWTLRDNYDTNLKSLVNNYAPFCGHKFRYFLFLDNIAAYSHGHLRRFYNELIAAARSMSSIPIIIQSDGMGWWTANASSELGTGYGAYYLRASQELEALNTDCVSTDFYDSNRYNIGGHSTMQSRVAMNRGWFRKFMAKTPVSEGGFGRGLGPKIISASRASGSNMIWLQIQHDGGTALSTYSWSESTSGANPPRTVNYPALSNSEMWCLLQVYHAGDNFDAGVAIQVDPTTPITIDNVNNRIGVPLTTPSAGNIQLLNRLSGGGNYGLAGTAPLTDTMAFDVFYNVDAIFDTLPSGAAGAMICDNQVDTANGIPYGVGLRATSTPIYVPPPTQAAQSLTIATPIFVKANSWHRIHGTGAGAPLSTLTLTVNGGAAFTPRGLVIDHRNKWECYVPIPASAGYCTIAVFRPGQSTADATTTFQLYADRKSILVACGLSQAAANTLFDSWVGVNGVCQDTAGTVPITDDVGGLPAQVANSWIGESGNAANRLVAAQTQALPGPDFRSTNLTDYVVGAPFYPCVIFEGGGGSCSMSSASTALSSALSGDWTFVLFGRAIYAPPFLSCGSISLQAGNGNFVLSRGSNTMTVPGNGAPNGASSAFYIVCRYQASTGTLGLSSNGNATEYTSVGHQGEAFSTGALTFSPAFGNVYVFAAFSSYLTGTPTSGDLQAVLKAVPTTSYVPWGTVNA